MEEIEKRTVDISKKDIDEYITPSNARDLRGKMVESIRSSMEDMCKIGVTPFLQGTIVANLNTSKKKMTILDGNHRIAAAKKFLEQNPKKKIRVSLQLYKNLTQKQENEVFLLTNNINKQNKDDK